MNEGYLDAMDSLQKTTLGNWRTMEEMKHLSKQLSEQLRVQNLLGVMNNSEVWSLLDEEQKRTVVGGVVDYVKRETEKKRGQERIEEATRSI